MKRVLLAAAVLAVGATTVVAQQEVAIQQQNLMKAQARSMYGVLGKMVKGDTPFDKAAADGALKALADDVAKIPTVFATNPKEGVKDATFGASQKIWQNKADFDAKVPAVTKAIGDAKVTDAASLKVAFDAVQAKCDSCHDTYRVKLK
ncbi:cytochrome c [Bradyrhizobium sp.]|uniref:c-type cytochrome n=1 Tax=Bradyrhizobium sp. TaxID=376 RepID=UPI001DBD99AA|nr:cytochrome c [Bradyrhizobium sp.]MBI5321009.1 cytochrome c [Bradyrhizobium sp.]